MTNQIGTSDSKFNNIWFGGTGTSRNYTNTTTVTRVSVAPVEVVLGGDSGRAAVSVAPIEVVFEPDYTIRVTQLAAELVNATPAGVRVTQLAAELIQGGSAPLRVTQLAAELVQGGSAPLRVSQFAIEVIGNFTLAPTAVTKSYPFIGNIIEGGVWIE
jgi:hypothetical protein